MENQLDSKFNITKQDLQWHLLNGERVVGSHVENNHGLSYLVVVTNIGKVFKAPINPGGPRLEWFRIG